jgi:hypothetical protein
MGAASVVEDMLMVGEMLGDRLASRKTVFTRFPLAGQCPLFDHNCKVLGISSRAADDQWRSDFGLTRLSQSLISTGRVLLMAELR